MAFNHNGIDYYIGSCSGKLTISIPAVKNYFKILEVKTIDSAHNKAQDIINDELSRISKEQKT